MTSKKLNIAAGLISLSGAAFIYIISRDFPERAAIMPSLIAGIMGFASLALLIKSFRQVEDSKSVLSNISWTILGFTIATWFSLIFLSRWINFFLLATCFLFINAMVLSGKPEKITDYAVAAAFSLMTSAALWLMFSYILNVDFPVEGLFSS